MPCACDQEQGPSLVPALLLLDSAASQVPAGPFLFRFALRSFRDSSQINHPTRHKANCVGGEGQLGTTELTPAEARRRGAVLERCFSFHSANQTAPDSNTRSNHSADLSSSDCFCSPFCRLPRIFGRAWLFSFPLAPSLIRTAGAAGLHVPRLAVMRLVESSSVAT